MIRRAQHPQPWCDDCDSGACSGEHAAYRQVPALHNPALPRDVGMAVTSVQVSPYFCEFEADAENSALPSVHVSITEPRTGDTYTAELTFPDALVLAHHLSAAVAAMRGVLDGTTAPHIICNCGDA